ncbi:iron-sulfur cluster assembly protein [Streptohalobacillus salinus]|uniref:Iron-sulfur cluster assembly protein n=1 Tax=Streptohalobacillus salinus TaxID=621096 RepID=A0A2V3WE79_9BACI|nr:iron-sulfur cluster assembly accessory protein [Streptohalobacillus salinus]PXW91394.1 iron-sulfur cluster assembly protein [Streptohalobacillus salinus]
MDVLIITDQAKLQIDDMLFQETNKKLRLRFGVKGSVCNSLSYTLGFDQAITKEDYTGTANGIPFTINQADLEILRGTKIDFIQNMMGGEFAILNPNTVAACECSPTNERA